MVVSSIRYSLSGVIPVGFRLFRLSIDLVLHAFMQCDVLICSVEIFFFYIYFKCYGCVVVHIWNMFIS
jgi:hypothetical protein